MPGEEGDRSPRFQRLLGALLTGAALVGAVVVAVLVSVTLVSRPSEGEATTTPVAAPIVRAAAFTSAQLGGEVLDQAGRRLQWEFAERPPIDLRSTQFDEQLQSLRDTDVDAVVVFAGTLGEEPAPVTTGSAELVTALRRTVPDRVALVVVGPPATSGTSPEVRAALKRAVGQARVHFVDPITANWGATPQTQAVALAGYLERLGVEAS